MKNTYKFHDGLFYPPELDYESIPSSAIEVNADEFQKAMSRPAGWTFLVSDDGVVMLVEPPKLNAEQLTGIADGQRLALRQVADTEIAWRQDAVDADIATEQEVADLAAWKKYRVLLMRVDTTTAPDINWPVKPE